MQMLLPLHEVVVLGICVYENYWDRHQLNVITSAISGLLVGYWSTCKVQARTKLLLHIVLANSLE